MFGLSPLSPAFGRDYKSKEDLLRDFHERKDFQTPFGQYANIDTCKVAGVKSIEIRYAKQRKVLIAHVIG